MLNSVGLMASRLAHANKSDTPRTMRARLPTDTQSRDAHLKRHQVCAPVVIVISPTEGYANGCASGCATSLTVACSDTILYEFIDCPRICAIRICIDEMIHSERTFYKRFTYEDCRVRIRAVSIIHTRRLTDASHLVLNKLCNVWAANLANSGIFQKTPAN